MSRLDNHCSSDDVNKEDECVPSSSEDSQDGVSSHMDNDDEPEFSQKNYDIEPCYYSMNGKSDRSCRGKVYRFREDNDLKGFQSHDGIMYRLRDSVFVEMSQHEPYVIAAISGFKYTKREHVVVKLTKYFRSDDIPEISLNLMKQERAELEITHQLCPKLLDRELFMSEIQVTQPVSCLRGKCLVEYVKDVRQARTIGDFSIDNDTFFYCLHYNQDSTKLASTHYAIRVGSSFQAKLPPVAKCSVGDEKDRDELLYRPNSIDEKIEKDYIRLARCFRTYTLSGNHMLDSQKNSRSQVSDLLMDEAIIQLHRSGYKVDDALSELNANDIILTTDVDNMTQDDAKKFAKGIKQLGKNFSRIHRELLPHHSREQLVSYYYLWKKTPEATKPKQAARRINPTSIKRPTKEKVKVSRPTSTEYLDFDSASESDVENNGPSGRACHHCYGAESKDWHHANNGLLLCTECRIHYKKYAKLRPVEKPAQIPACLFKRSNSDEEESGVRTRAGKKEQRRRTPSSMSETPDRRSPSGASNGAPHLTAEETPTKRLNGAAKRTAKRPLHNGVNNVDKANSVEPADSPPPKLTNGLTNGHGPGPSTPNGETANKKMKLEQSDYDDDEEGRTMRIVEEDEDEPMPVLNGFKKEEPVEEMKLEINGLVKEENVMENPTTSCGTIESESLASVELGAGGENGSEIKVELTTNGEVEEEESVEPDDENDTYEVNGTEIAYESKNATYVQFYVRTCGPRSARTDLQYKFKPGSTYDQSMKTKAEKKKAHAEQSQQRKQDPETASKLLSQQAMMKKNEQQQQAQQAQQQQQQAAQMQQQMQQQLHAAAMMGHLPPEVMRQMMPQQFGMDPATAILMQQLMHAHQQPQLQNIQQHLAMQHMEQQAAAQHQLLRMQEMAHQHQQQQQQKMVDQQRNAAAAQQQAREREQRERERVAAIALQQQQQQAVNAANQLHPGLMAQVMAMSQGGNSQEFARIMEMHAHVHAQQQAMQQAAVAQQQAAAAAAQQQREHELRERREREQREQREREQREREQREREARDREQREQAAREAQAQQQAAQAAAMAAQQNMPMNMDPQAAAQLQHMLLMLNPGLMAQFQAHQAAQQQQQHQQSGANPLQLLQQGIMQQPPMSAEMIRRLHDGGLRPQHP